MDNHMTATTHALIGGAIAASVSNPAVGIPLAIISHPLVDLIPHWDVGRNWRLKPKMTLFLEASLDCLIGLTVSYFFFGQHINLIYFLTVVFFSEIWDVIEAPYWFLDWNFPPFSWIYNFQHNMQGRTTFSPWGILTQVVTVIVIVLSLRMFT